MSQLVPWLLVAGLGALGAWLRVAVSAAVAVRRPGPFPLGTLVVNLSGTLLLGGLVGLGVDGTALLVLGGGLLGSYTTFSTWMVESERLVAGGRIGTMWLNLLVATVGGLAAGSVGWVAGAALA